MQVKLEKPMGGGVALRANIFRQILLPFLAHSSSNLITSKINKFHHKEHICKF
ncbi:hypothetical protein CRECT_1907 [Campylobacter rectus]|uniref:Uncharacterized protein n=1 Tax=Campylobacter rectus TaxID=203 RepID=A0A6G5QPK1_CAMRE|nr:hypothetical protein CRECT_1907 [Campylobacter rectus]